MRGTILKHHSIRKAENHCARVYKLEGLIEEGGPPCGYGETISMLDEDSSVAVVGSPTLLPCAREEAHQFPRMNLGGIVPWFVTGTLGRRTR